MSKYEPLWNYIKDNNKDSYKLTYKKELISYGYEVTKISMKDKTVLFNKLKQEK